MSMRTNYADCRCGERIFLRTIGAGSEPQWVHLEPFRPSATQICEDGDTAEPVAGSESFSRSG